MSNDWAKYIYVSCRSCAFSTAEADSTWTCTRHDAKDIPLDFQHEGCDDHVIHPDMVPWPSEPSDYPWTIVYHIDGKRVENGHPDHNIFASSEILANAHACGDDTVQEIRKLWPGAKVVK